MKDAVCEAETFVKERYPKAQMCGYIKNGNNGTDEVGTFIQSELRIGIILSDDIVGTIEVIDYTAAWENAKQHILNNTIPKP